MIFWVSFLKHQSKWRNQTMWLWKKSPCLAHPQFLFWNDIGKKALDWLWAQIGAFDWLTEMHTDFGHVSPKKKCLLIPRGRNQSKFGLNISPNISFHSSVHSRAEKWLYNVIHWKSNLARPCLRLLSYSQAWIWLQKVNSSTKNLDQTTAFVIFFPEKMHISLFQFQINFEMTMTIIMKITKSQRYIEIYGPYLREYRMFTAIR